MKNPFSMPRGGAVLRSLAVCLGFAVLEGLLADADAAQKYAAMRLPAFSPPFWAWILIGIAYYVICFTVLFRVFRADRLVSVTVHATELFWFVIGSTMRSKSTKMNT